MDLLNKFWHIVLFVLIVGLFTYDNLNYRYMKNFSMESYLENPQKYGGYKGQQFGKIINISEGHFYFDMGSQTIKVYGSGVKKAILGETLLFLHYRKDGKIGLIDYHNYNYNYLLYIISLFAFVIFIVIFFKEWKFTFWRFESA